MEANIVLASWSNLLIYSAMAVYTLAFLIYSVDLFGDRGNEARSRLKAGQRSSKRTSSAGTVARTSRHANSGGVALAEAEVDGDDSDSDSVESSPSRLEVRRWARVGTSFTVIAVLLHLAAIVTRTMAVMRVPWGNMMEYAMVASALTVLTYLISLRFKDLRYLGTFVAAAGLIVLGLCITVFYTEAAQLIPALQTYWIFIHVPIAILSTALLSISAGSTLVQILKAWWEKRTLGYVAGTQRPKVAVVTKDSTAGKDAAANGKDASAKTSAKTKADPVKKMRFLERLPASDEIESVAYRLAAVGFITWTFTLIAGAVWAEVAWGRPWGWDTKEIWTFIVWVVYAAYLHSRATRGWTPLAIATLNLAGFLTVVFNFSIVNMFFNGLHSYSGLE